MKIEIDFPDDIICGLLCCAREGGSNDWLRKIEVNYPEGGRETMRKIYINESLSGREGLAHESPWLALYVTPLVEGGSWTCTIDEEYEKGSGVTFTLDRKAIERGIVVMRDKYPKHFGDALAHNDDAYTGDTFIQCALFGEAIFG